MTTVALAGDWHGNVRWARARIADVAARQIGVILHLGDFGIWPGASGEQYLLDVEKTCAEHGVDIWITPGNHDDWGRLTAMWARPESAGQPLQLTGHIRVLSCRPVYARRHGDGEMSRSPTGNTARVGNVQPVQLQYGYSTHVEPAC